MAKQLGKEGKPAKAEKAKEAAASAGNVTRETFRESVNELVEANRVLKAATETRKRVRKVIKARGIELGHLDAVVRMADWDREEVRQAFEYRRQYAEWLGLPIGSQADLFKGMSDAERLAAEWEARGATDFYAAKTGQAPEDCPEENKLDYKRGFKRAKGEHVADNPAPKQKDKPKGPKTDDQGRIIAPDPDPKMEKEFEQAADTEFQ